VPLAIYCQHRRFACCNLTEVEGIFPPTPHLPVFREESVLVARQWFQPIAWRLGINATVDCEGVRRALEVGNTLQNTVVVTENYPVLVRDSI
jgi:hypothetical protein